MQSDTTEVTGIVFNIQRFSLHDEPGIRTTVFLKGCPLRCAWCSNPESLRTQPEIITRDVKCIRCGKCIETCWSGIWTSKTSGFRNFKGSHQVRYAK